MPKILRIYASAGAGHRKAAEAICEAVAAKFDKKDVVLIDSLDFTNRLFSWLYGKKYLTLVSRLPNIWGFFYHFLDNKLIYKLFWFPRRLINALNCRRLEDFILNQKPDVIISTHFMANEVVSHLKRVSALECHLLCAVTDYYVHSFWVAPGVDFYFLGAECARADLLGWGISSEKIFITGIPVQHKFFEVLDKGRIREKIGLDKNLFTVLVIGGGFGVGPLEELVEETGMISPDLQFLIVCGRNERLYADINRLVQSRRIRANVYGFVDNVDELMSASDLLITKAGGLTVSEAQAKCLPVVFIKPIPGQEEKNSRFFESLGAAFVEKDVWGVSGRVKDLFSDPDRLKSMALSIKNTVQPDPAGRIADFIRGF